VQLPYILSNILSWVITERWKSAGFYTSCEEFFHDVVSARCKININLLGILVVVFLAEKFRHAATRRVRQLSLQEEIRITYWGVDKVKIKEMAAGLGSNKMSICRDIIALKNLPVNVPENPGCPRTWGWRNIRRHTKFKFVHWLKNGIPKGDEIHTVLVLKKPIFMYLIN
jgi:hypothetical protein